MVILFLGGRTLELADVYSLIEAVVKLWAVVFLFRVLRSSL